MASQAQISLVKMKSNAVGSSSKNRSIEYSDSEYQTSANNKSQGRSSGRPHSSSLKHQSKNTIHLLS